MWDTYKVRKSFHMYSLCNENCTSVFCINSLYEYDHFKYCSYTSLFTVLLIWKAWKLLPSVLRYEWLVFYIMLPLCTLDNDSIVMVNFSPHFFPSPKTLNSNIIITWLNWIFLFFPTLKKFAVSSGKNFHKKLKCNCSKQVKYSHWWLFGNVA